MKIIGSSTILRLSIPIILVFTTLTYPLSSTQSNATTRNNETNDNLVELVVNPKTNMIYLANSVPSNTTLIAINGSNNAVVSSISLDLTAEETERLFGVKDYGAITIREVVDLEVNTNNNTVYIWTIYRYVNEWNVTGHSSLFIVVNGSTNSVQSVIPEYNPEHYFLDFDENTNTLYALRDIQCIPCPQCGACPPDSMLKINGSTNSIIEVKEILWGIDNSVFNHNSDSNEFYFFSGGDEPIILVLDSELEYYSGIMIDSRQDANVTDIEVNPVTNTIYSIEQPGSGAASIAIIDRNATKVVERITLPQSFVPSDMVVNPQTNTVYVINAAKGGVVVLDGEANEPIKIIKFADDGERGRLAVNPDTNTIYALSGRLVVINGTTNTVISGTSEESEELLQRCSELGIEEEECSEEAILGRECLGMNCGSIGTDQIEVLQNPTMLTLFGVLAAGIGGAGALFYIKSRKNTKL